MQLNILMFFVHIYLSCSEDQVEVELPEGRVRGSVEISDMGRRFYSFYGIPYALPPTGERRFKRPEPVESWDSVKGGKIIECAQENTGREVLFNWGSNVRGVEDCCEYLHF